MPDYSSLSTQINQFKSAATALMTNVNDPLNANELQLVGAALNQMGNTLGVADINNSVVDGVTTINAAKDAAITAFNSGTNGTRLTEAESDITVLEGKVTNIEGFVSTNGAQYTTLQSTVAGLQSSLATVPSVWKIITSNYTATNNDRLLVQASAAGLVITLPLNPAAGFTVEFVDTLGTAATIPFTVARNSQNIQRVAENLVYNVNGGVLRLIYVDAPRGWVRA
jgi:hypothetical protein